MPTPKTSESVAAQRIKPERITRPIQLLAAWLTGLVLLDGIFLTAASWLSRPTWIAGTLVVAAVVNVPLFLIAIFILQTRFRPEMQEDSFYSKYLVERQKRAELRADKLQEELKRLGSMADVGVSLSQEYVERVTSMLDLDEPEKARLRRAVRESVRAREVQLSQELSREALGELQPFLLSPLANLDSSAEGGEALLKRVAQLRYTGTASAFSNVSNEDIVPVDLHGALGRVCDALRKRIDQDKKRIAVSFPEGPIDVLATRGIVEVTLAEVLTNAVVYSPADSTIEVSVTRVGDDRLKIEVRNSITSRAASSIDTSKLFEPGYRGTQSAEHYSAGAGMGLHLVKRLVQSVGGTVELDLKDTTFSTSLFLSHRAGSQK
jgi:signal transduction histidine kinase